MDQKSEYTLSLRIEGESIDFGEIDEALGIVGSRILVDRPSTRFRTRQNYRRWEAEASRLSVRFFDNINDAFSALDCARLASGVADLALYEGGKVYWWCGCFHGVTPAHTLMPRALLGILGRARAPVILDTYFSPESTYVAAVSDVEDIGEQLVDDFGHRYRFTLTDSELPPPIVSWGSYFDDFTEGLESVLGGLTDVECDEALLRGAVRRIVCEHTQHAFDGGPQLSAEQSLAIASRGLDLEIVWIND